MNGLNGVEVEHFKIVGGGHTWAGTAFPSSGTNFDIDASTEIWRFFSKYDINGLISTTTSFVEVENTNTKLLKIVEMLEML